MLAGVVPLRDVLSLRVALCVEGIDAEFGDVATKTPYQRVDIFDADRVRVDNILKRFPRVMMGTAKRKAKTADPTLLRRPQLISSKETD